MRKTVFCMSILVSLVGFSNSPVLSQSVHEGTIYGVISDSMCKFDHSGMIKAGHAKDSADRTKKCVSKGSKLVLADEKNNIVYGLANPSKANQFAGKRVSVEGHIDTKAKVVHIHSIKAE